MSLRSSSRCPRRATMGWLPGTRILTWVGLGDNCFLQGTGTAEAAPSDGIDYTGRVGPADHLPRSVGGRSTRRPGHLAPAQQVEVQVLHALTGVPSDVGDQPPARTIHAFGPGEV